MSEVAGSGVAGEQGRRVTGLRGLDRTEVRAVVARDVRAMRRSPAVLVPMTVVPLLLLVVLPLVLTLATINTTSLDVVPLLERLPGGISEPILSLPEAERAVILVVRYLLAPLFIIVPLMVSAVLASDAFAGELDRRTLEALLHLPVGDRELFVGKVLVTFLPAVLLSWVGFALFALGADILAWSTLGRPLVPTAQWGVLIGLIAPAVALLGLALMVRVSARVGGAQEANQLGGAVVLPLIFVAVGQTTVLLLAPVPAAMGVGLVIAAVALWVLRGGAKRFNRNRLGARL